MWSTMYRGLGLGCHHLALLHLNRFNERVSTSCGHCNSVSHMQYLVECYPSSWNVYWSWVHQLCLQNGLMRNSARPPAMFSMELTTEVLSLEILRHGLPRRSCFSIDLLQHKTGGLRLDRPTSSWQSITDDFKTSSQDRPSTSLGLCEDN
jgi:hypothetical protein